MTRFIFEACSDVSRRGFMYILPVLVLFLSIQCQEKPEPVKEEPQSDFQVKVVKQYCRMCSKVIMPYTSCRINLNAGEKMNTCCAYCGVMALLRIKRENRKGETTCYSTGSKIDMMDAFYVVNSDEAPCCRPSVLAFSSKEEAEKFVQAKNGVVKKLDEVVGSLKPRKSNNK